MVIDREDENGDTLTVEFFSISSTIYYASCIEYVYFRFEYIFIEAYAN